MKFQRDVIFSWVITGITLMIVGFGRTHMFILKTFRQKQNAFYFLFLMWVHYLIIKNLKKQEWLSM